MKSKAYESIAIDGPSIIGVRRSVSKRQLASRSVSVH